MKVSSKNVYIKVRIVKCVDLYEGETCKNVYIKMSQ